MTAALLAKRILLVHDSFVARETLSMLLGSCGCQVDVAPCTTSALKTLMGPTPPDVVVLELKVLQAGAWPPEGATRSAPVVALCDVPEQCDQARALGACSVLHEPFGPIELLQAVSHCCGEGPLVATATPSAG